MNSIFVSLREFLNNRRDIGHLLSVSNMDGTGGMYIEATNETETMKALLAILTIITLGSCYSHKEIQVEMINAELIKIDTIYRFSDLHQQLTWRGSDNAEYVSFAALDRLYAVGTRMMVLRTR